MSDSLVSVASMHAAPEALPLPPFHLLRLSVTDRCNFRCRYCMPARSTAQPRSTAPLPFAQLAENVHWLARQLPIQRIKLTGGEPLLRPALPDLIARLASIPGVCEVSMTTNGSLLARHARALKAAGLARVNVSLDSMDPARFATLARGARLEDTLAGINAALDAGLRPLKLNAVLQRSAWQQDLPRLLDLAAARGLELRFIELMRTGTEREWCTSEFVSVGEVKSWLASQTALSDMPEPGSRPARHTLMLWNGVPLRVGWISPLSHPFCDSCERLRMDAQGRVRRCLMDPHIVDIPALRHLHGDPAALHAFLAYLGGKHSPAGMDSDAAMNQIGG